MLKISIIIPAYNAEVYLNDTLMSLQKQTFKDFEAIVIDDGSTDDTVSVFQESVSGDSRFKLIQKNNGGVSSARNTGLLNAKGEYLSFLDADDTYDQKFLEYMFNEINKGYDVVYCGYNYIHQDGSFYKRMRTTFSRNQVGEKYLKRKIQFHTTSIMLRSEYVKKKNFQFIEGISWGEDIEFFSKCLLGTEKISYVKKHLSNYRHEHSEFQLSDFSPDKIDKNILLFENMLKNKDININNTVDRIIREFRIPAFIIYPLLYEFNYKEELKQIREFVNKYNYYIKSISLINGVRSIKLKIARNKLYRILN